MKRPNGQNERTVAKRTKTFNQEPGELGIIESVSLRNFMCHENLKFDFDPHMNFIVGLNGSGKSAILTGIILALGGKSSSTGRYANIKGFIKTSKQSATVAVTLKNCGPSAYKPEEFGSKIVVERTINTDGVSQYKLKSENGRIVSNSKEELKNLLDTMDIKIENPVTVLTQEISRNFLLQMKEDKLFTLFYKGTGLEKLDERYKGCSDATKQNEVEILKKKEILVLKEQELKQLKMLLDNAARIDEYRNELLWAGVIEIEKQKAEKKTQYEKAKELSSSTKQKLDQCKADQKKISELLEKYQKDAKDCEVAMNAQREDIARLKSEMVAIQNSIREFQGVLNRNNRELQRKMEEIVSLENMMNEIRARNQNDIAEEQARHQEKIKKLEAELRAVIEKINLGSEERQKALANEEMNFEQKILSSKSEINQSKYKIQEMERQLTKVRAGMQQRINVYGSEMKAVLDDIELANRNGQFSKKPVGPIGLYMSVKDEKWCFAIENYLKTRLIGFCCDDVSDSQKLDAIFAKHYRGKKSPPVNISKFQESHVGEANRTQSPYPTILDVLEIKHPVVANFLLDQYSIENVLLIDDYSSARKLMMYSAPRNCNRAFTLNGDELRPDPFRHYSCLQTNTLGILKSLSQSEIKDREQDLANEKNELHRKENDLLQLQKESFEKRREREGYNSEKTKLLAQKSSLERKLNEEREFENPKDLDGLQGDLDELMREKSIFEDQIEKIENALSKQKDELAKVTEEFKTKTSFLKDQQSKRYEANEKIVTLENSKENKQTRITQLGVELSKATSEEKTFFEDHKIICKATEKAISNAEKICPRINTEKSTEMLRTLLEETEKAFRNQSKLDRESMQEQYLEKYDRLVKHKAEYVNLERKIKKMQNMLKSRLEMMAEIRNFTALNLSLSFTTMLKENNFVGSVDASFDSKTLKIEAKPNKIGTKTGGKQQTSNLSGGERSYVTIAFLLALWDRIEMPFRILDEYDVFMDSDNRHLSVNLLIRNAEDKKNMQFIFLTPQELPSVRNCPEIKVHKMPAPKRNKS